MDDDARRSRLDRAASVLQVSALRPVEELPGALAGTVYDASRRASEVVLVALDGVEQVAALAERVRSAGTGLVVRGASSGVIVVVCAGTGSVRALAGLVLAHGAGWSHDVDGNDGSDDDEERSPVGAERDRGAGAGLHGHVHPRAGRGDR